MRRFHKNFLETGFIALTNVVIRIMSWTMCWTIYFALDF